MKMLVKGLANNNPVSSLAENLAGQATVVIHRMLFQQLSFFHNLTMVSNLQIEFTGNRTCFKLPFTLDI
jgi:hypothetical protein